MRAGHDTSFLSAVPNDADNLLREAAIELDAIGHRYFYCGRISRKWAEANTRSLITQGRRLNEARTWSSKLVQRIVLFSKDIWQFRNEVQSFVSSEAKERHD